ncbi:MAG: hypothetical protein LC778_19860 [Acidobacteria bacterium]|nr:hypothetical protein [Acidobacteriota bacterium]
MKEISKKGCVKMREKEKERMKEIINAKNLKLLPLVKSENGGRVVEILEACFSKSPDWLDKHCEPRADQKNLDGLSMVEESGLTRHHVKKALREICVHYKSVSEYIKAPDKFQGYYYCSYLDVKNHYRTRYFRNDTLVDSHLEALWDAQSIQLETHSAEGKSEQKAT